MNKVFISRPNNNVPWGFRLEGGYEYNEPFVLTNIVVNSPADGKISCGDMLIAIAGNNVTKMTHQDVLEIIKRCGNALYLTIKKIDFQTQIDTNGICQSINQRSLSNETANISSMPFFNTDVFADTTIPKIDMSSQQTQEFSNIPAVIAKSLSLPGGPKPFTYTPGGLDLSKIVESARARRRHKSVSERQNNTNQSMNRRMNLSSDQTNRYSNTNINPMQPFSYTSEVPKSPRKHIEHDTNVITNSRSFQMLQGWISDSEKSTTPNLSQSLSKSATTSLIESNCNDRNDLIHHSSLSAQSSLPSRSFRYLQEQYKNDDQNRMTTSIYQPQSLNTTNSALRYNNDSYTSSRTSKYLQNHYVPLQATSTVHPKPINNRNDIAQIYHKLPPSSRPHEPEAPRYKGSAVPSRAFRFLQAMTENDSNSSVGYSRPNFLSTSFVNDEHDDSINSSKLNDHPSRTFKYLQEMTGENRSERRTNSLSADVYSRNINTNFK